MIRPAVVAPNPFRPSPAKIHRYRAPATEHDVAAFDVTVRDAVRMNVIKRGNNLAVMQHFGKGMRCSRIVCKVSPRNSSIAK
jgi:hypothetical protein